jgi:hypothetical protein
MENKKLNLKQIQDLHAFTRAHCVEYHDLQIELVDHLANDIETMWEEQPELSFEEAKHKAFKKFGVFGFMEPIEKKQKAMSKLYLKFLLQEVKEWFEIPKIVITITLFLGFFTAFSLEYTGTLAIMFYAMIVLWTIYKSMVLNRQFRRRREISNKKWLLEEIIFKQAGGIMLLFLSQCYIVFDISEKVGNNVYALIVLSIGFTMLTLISYISFELLPKKAEILLEQTYPEYKLL